MGQGVSPINILLVCIKRHMASALRREHLHHHGKGAHLRGSGLFSSLARPFLTQLGKKVAQGALDKSGEAAGKILGAVADKAADKIKGKGTIKDVKRQSLTDQLKTGDASMLALQPLDGSSMRFVRRKRA
jgi:hypothetical protein